MGESNHNPPRFILGQPLALEETRHVEFKEVRGPNPVKAIVNAADEYAVAFLNSEGGWAGALATHAHTERRCEVFAAVLHENCWFDGKDYPPYIRSP